MKKLLFIILIITVHVSGFSQKKDTPVSDSGRKHSKTLPDKGNVFQKTESGLKYKFIEDSAGTNAEKGGLIVVHLKFENAKDTFDTYKSGQPISLHLMSPFKGSLEEGLTYTSIGDSIVIAVSNDSLYTKAFQQQSLPPEIKAGSFTTFNIRVIDVYSRERLEKELKERRNQKTQEAIRQMSEMKKHVIDSSQAQLKKDDDIIKEYLKKNKIEAQRTENGIYYTIAQAGTGEKPEAGDSVSLHYIGKFLDGTEFDKSTSDNPFVFQLAVGMVIPGFDEAVMKLNAGSKATIYIPSSLAYGKEGVKKTDNEYVIKPNTPLIFVLDILEVKKNKK